MQLFVYSAYFLWIYKRGVIYVLLIFRMLENILTDDVKAQDRVNAFTFLYMGHRSNANLALEFLKERIDDVRRAYVFTIIIIIIIITGVH